jgi:hypothetical protein
MTDTQGTTPEVNGAADKKKVPWGKIFKVAFYLDVAFAVIMTVVQATMLDALANLAHYSGAGYWAMMVATIIMSMLLNLFIGLVGEIVLAGGIFVVFVLIAFFSSRKPQQGSSEQKGEVEEDQTT